MIQKEKVARPECVRPEHLDYLDELRESGITNMFGAASFLKAEFPDLAEDKAKKVLAYWMKTFSERRDLREKEVGENEN